MVDPTLPDPASVETARPGPDGPRARPRRVPSLPTVLASAACFVVVFEFLAFQLRSGHDPAIGASAGAGEPTAARPRPVVVHRRIIVRRVVESSPDASGVAVASGSPSTGSTSTAPAAAPVAAPAPAPAPVTSTS